MNESYDTVHLRECEQLRESLYELRCELARLVGYYETSGAIPVQMVDELLDRSDA